MTPPTDKKYTIAKYVNPTETKIVSGNFNTIDEAIKFFNIDTSKYFIMKIEEKVLCDNGTQEWKTLLDRTYILKQQL